MNERRRWAFRRRIEYGVGFFATLLFISGGSYALFHEDTYSCFDGLQNGEERGVDCGGACVRICALDTIPPKILWANSFEIVPGQYNTVAYVENLNEIAATRQLKYTLELYDGNTLVTTRTGATILPPNSIYPIFEGRIITDGREITETKLILEPVEVWQPANLGREQFRTSGINLTGADAQPRLDVSIENTELTSAGRVEIVATLFNESGAPLTASQTYVDDISPRSSKDIVFTWPNSIAKTVSSCIIPTDVVLAIDLSGSMNNDGEVPPQPVTDALLAAGDFIERLAEKDNAGVVTFASTAEVQTELTSTHQNTSNLIQMLRIKPEEETGFTNTVAALEAARLELSSSRHNINARRVLVLLTDGLPTGKQDQAEIITEVETKARELFREGVIVYAIGLGQNVDSEFISNVASTRDRAFFAPNRNDLAQIYSEITSSLCETGTAKIDIIAKTEANFTPLR